MKAHFIYKLINISRSRFWMYVLGSYLIGIGAYMSLTDAVITKPEIIWWLIYFTFPANLFVYGINDLADYDTDTFNEKKGTYEEKISRDIKTKRALIFAILLTNIPFLVYFLTTYNIQILELVFLSIFIIFNIFYSLPPLRLKAKPFYDCFSNGIICVAVGLLGYVAVGGTSFSIAAIIAGILWPTAMHAFSAIPDIAADKQANIQTVATILGVKNTLRFCTLLYLIIVAVFLADSLYIHALLLIPYLYLMVRAFTSISDTKKMFAVYKTFPYITYVIGYLTYFFNVVL